jgi:hypothetical protein
MTTYYLYVKTHKTTGLKYLGFTKQNPFTYLGSGVYWRRHLTTHGFEIDTEILFETTNKNEIKLVGEEYSKKWNIVDSDQWANLKPETGEGGLSSHSHESKEKIRRYQKNEKTWSNKALQSRLENCLKNAENRKGKGWSESQRISRLNTYVHKNLDIALKIIELFDQGMNKRQISLTLGITWEKVKYSLLNRDAFEGEIKLRAN